MISGLLGVAGLASGSPLTLAGSGLLRNFGIISSNSGGGWYASSLIYSESFLAMSEAMGAAPFKAGSIYNDLYTSNLLNESEAEDRFGDINTTLAACKSLIKAAVKVAKMTGVLEDVPFIPTPPAWSIQDLKLLLATADTGGVSWPGLILDILSSTANLTASLPVGARVNEFAKGKLWLAAGSLMTPGPPGGNSSWNPPGKVYLNKPSLLNPSKYIAYVASTGDGTAQFPAYVPAKYSVVLGAGEEQNAPLPFCATDECFGLRYDYTVKTLTKSHSMSSPPLSEAYEAAFSSKAGRLPVYQVVASSSAFVGAVDLSPKLSPLYGACIQATAPSCSASDGEAFSKAQQVLMPNITSAYTNESFRTELASSALASVIDGAYTDNTGIAHAVAAGATEVVYFASGYDLPRLFAPSNSLVGEGIQAAMAFQVFAQSAEDVEAQIRGFRSFAIPPGNGTYLKNFAFGTIPATTVECPWFGVRAGVDVTIYMVLVNVSLGMGGLDDYDFYGEAVNEITSSLAYEPNRPLALELLATVRGRGLSQEG